MFQFNFDPSKGETPASIAQKRALVAQIMGSQRAPSTLGEGFAALGDGIAANVLGGRADAGQRAGDESFAGKQKGYLASLLSGGTPAPYNGGGATPSFGSPAHAPGGENAAYIRQGMIDRGLPDHIADGFLMNFQDESGLNSGINEQNPTVPGSRGGYGLYQLTGPRRVAYEQFAQQKGVDPSNVDAQLDFMMSELQGPEASAARSIFASQDAGSAASAIVNDFLRPAEEHRSRRSARYTGGHQPVQVASLGDASAYAPQTAPQAIEGAFPQLPAPIQQLPASPLQVTAQAPMHQPQQAQGVDPQRMQAIFDVLSHPFADEGTKAMALQDLQSIQQQQSPAYQQQMRAGDLGIQKAEFELDQARNPGKKPPIEVGGVLVDPDTYQPVFDSRQQPEIPDSVQALDLRAERAGLERGTPAYNDFMVKGGAGSGQTINVGGNNDIGTIPSGKMVTRDSAGNITGMVDIPGGPTAQAAQAAEEATAAGATQTQRYGNVVIEDIGRAVTAIEKDPALTTGLVGQWLSGIGGTPANRVNNLLTTVKANAGFDRLQAMRDASPTGGALGAVSEKELALLNSAIGSLEQSNTSDDLTYNLKRVQQIYGDIVNGPKSTPNQSQAPGGIDALLEKYR